MPPPTSTFLPRIPLAPPEILPWPAGSERTLWSVMIPVYNSIVFLKDAIESVLMQDPGPGVMQVEVVDDCSTDGDIEALVGETGNGRVAYFRQPQNVGSLRNFETCIRRSRGHYVHLLHADDRVKKGFYAQLGELFHTYPAAGAAFCAWDYIDSEGKYTRESIVEAQAPCLLDDWLMKLAEHGRLQYVTIAVKREVYERLGSFFGVTYGEDWEMWTRIAQFYPTAYTPESLAEYREHHSSISSNSFLSGQNIRDIARVIDIINDYLPANDRKRLKQLALRNYIHWAIDATFKLWMTTGNRRAVMSQTSEMLRVYRDSWSIRKIAVLRMRVAGSRLLTRRSQKIK